MYQPLVIRFWKKGASDYPVYDIIVTPKSHRYRGAFLERLGHYNPHGREKLFFFNGQRLGYWLNRGASLHPKISLHLPTEYSVIQASPEKVKEIVQKRRQILLSLAQRNLKQRRQLERSRKLAKTKLLKLLRQRNLPSQKRRRRSLKLKNLRRLPWSRRQSYPKPKQNKIAISYSPKPSHYRYPLRRRQPYRPRRPFWFNKYQPLWKPLSPKKPKTFNTSLKKFAQKLRQI